MIAVAAASTAVILAACSSSAGSDSVRPDTSDAAVTSRAAASTASASSDAAPKFTVTQMTSSDGQAELLVRPKGPITGLVVFMHGLDSDQNQIADDSQLETIGGVLVKAGFAIVSSNAHGNNVGNPASVRDQRLAVADARHRLGHVRRVDILAFSMGGLDALLTASSHRIKGLHALALISPAVDQRTFATGPFAGQVRAAFGNPKADAVSKTLKRSDPLLQPVHTYAGYRYHFWHSPQDQTVPATQSMAMVRYLATGGIHAALTPLTGDHGDLSTLDPADVLHLFQSSTT